MRHAVIMFAAVSCLSVLACGQSAEELVNKNIEAKGGIDKIKAAKPAHDRQTDCRRRDRSAALQENVRPNLVRETFTLQGMTAVTPTTAPPDGRSSRSADAKIPN